MAWIVVMTKPNSEAIAVENLKRQGYGYYFPRILTSKGATTLVRPLFPRYIFAQSDGTWYSLRSTRGVSYVLMNDDGPATVSDSVIESIRSKENERGLIDLRADKPEKFVKGEAVRATEGPLTGLDLIYEQRLSDKERVKVLADLLGRQVPVIIEEKVLVASSASR
ncbi:MAG TPA: transcription termination/antitermination NusG family protein [Candidatus Angelobacter sp.]|nr:transcription termination/antitermination NusG family protein [Candidatus Angelobacter sp.]